MRMGLAAVAAGFLLASHAVPSAAQRADSAIAPGSNALLAQGAKAQAAGDLDRATGLYESALALDPRNRSAYIALAQIARAQGLPGKAVGLFREALGLDPQDSVALAGQGLALIDRGAIDRARENLAEATRRCADDCGHVTALADALAAADAAKTIAVDAVKPVPIASVGGSPAQP